MRRSYLDYAMSVIVARALPDVRDGLKPVHRRILYSMQMNGNVWNRRYLKSARITGDVMGKYHPHGELAIYDAMVRMAQNFSMRLPLIDGQGNFGSAANIPPHNLGEVIGACCAYLDNPAITIGELMEYVPARDFPTGGIIIGRAGSNAAYHTGRGAIVLRAKHHIEEIHGREALVF